LTGFVDRHLRKKGAAPANLAASSPLLERARGVIPASVDRLLGDQRDRVELLARRTANLHLALASEHETPDFVPEPFNAMHQRSLYESARVRLDRTFRLVERKLGGLPAPTAKRAHAVVVRKKEIDARLRKVADTRIEARKIRIHGDYHLGQVLWTGSDYVILDFEGEPARPLNERRFKRSPLVDVAGMLRSFHYAAVTALRDPRLRSAQQKQIEPWLDAWHAWISTTYLRAYLDALGTGLLPPNDEHLALLLDFFVLDKCIYEIGYEIDNRPDWLAIPLEGIRGILDA
jgi:maltose alpha-D-glucosyltransferase/alpha-amylase